MDEADRLLRQTQTHQQPVGRQRTREYRDTRDTRRSERSARVTPSDLFIAVCEGRINRTERIIGPIISVLLHITDILIFYYIFIVLVVLLCTSNHPFMKHYSNGCTPAGETGGSAFESSSVIFHFFRRTEIYIFCVCVNTS